MKKSFKKHEIFMKNLKKNMKNHEQNFKKNMKKSWKKQKKHEKHMFSQKNNPHLSITKAQKLDGKHKKTTNNKNKSNKQF